MSDIKIAVVEDEEDLLDNMLSYLELNNFQVWGAASAEDFYKKLLKFSVDVVILDINLPHENGLEIAQYLQDMPEIIIIIVSARQTVDDRLTALKFGAERYLLKPVDMKELVANVHAALRGRIQQSNSAQWLLHEKSWLLISPENHAISLTASEFFFLKLVISAKGKIVLRTLLIEEIFSDKSYANVNDRLDTLVARLRRKVQKELPEPLPLKTVTAIGYIFTAPAKIQT